MSKSTRFLMFVLAGLAGIAIWLVLTADQPESEGAASVRGDAEFADIRSANLDVATPDEGNREGLQNPAHVSDDSEGAAQAEVIKPYVTHDLNGTLTLLDEFGNGPFLEDGTFAFWLWQEDDASYHEVQVERGVWETVLPHGVRISLAEVELGGRIAAFNAEGGPPIAVPASCYLELEAYLPKASRLRVYANDTRAELDQVTVVMERRGITYRQHPGEFGEENRVVENASSPIELEVVSGVRIDEFVTYFIRAPGYGWESLKMQHSVGGTYNVYLEPAGSLEVNLSEFDPGLFPAFRLWRYGKPFLVHPLSWERELKFDHIDEGLYLASVDIGPNWRNLERLGEAEVQIHAGGMTVVDLELSAGKKHERGQLKGTLVVPPEWDLQSFRILLRLSGAVASKRDSMRLATDVELANVPGRENAWRFDFPDLIAGTWKFGVEPTLFTINVEVTSEESEDTVIELPPPADWIVRTIDRDTREPALVEELRYLVPDCYTSQARLAERGSRSNEFKIRAPLGRVVLRTAGEGYRSSSKSVVLDAATGEIELEVRGECGVTLTGRLGRRQIPWKENWRVWANERGGDGRTYESELGDGSMRLFFSEPGEYIIKVEVTDDDEFVVASEVHVVVEAGSFSSAEVELVRK